MEIPDQSVKPLVIHIIHEDGAGGGPVALRNNCTFLQESYRNMCIYGGRGSIAAYCRERGIGGISIPLHRKFLIPFGFAALVFLLVKHRPAAVLLYGQWAGPVGALAARVAGIGAIAYITHFPAFYTDRSLLRLIRNRMVEWLPCRLSASVVTPSESNRAQYVMRRLVAEEKTTVIHSTIKPESKISIQERQSFRAQCGWSSEHCHVVSVGRLTEQKRVDWLLRSWPMVEKAVPHARLWIVGDGPEEQALRDLAQHSGLKNVGFLGAHPDGPRFIAGADIVVMTSQYEGHAHVPLEALVNGVPIIASNVDGVRESVQDGVEGFLVSPGDTGGMATRLIELIQSPEMRSEMGRRAELRARDFYPEVVMPAYRKLIDNMLTRQ